MGIFYDMANGRFQSPPAQDRAAPARDGMVPALGMHRLDPSPARTAAQPHAQVIHLIRALLSTD
jgi:hypothetical protein